MIARRPTDPADSFELLEAPEAAPTRPAILIVDDDPLQVALLSHWIAKDAPAFTRAIATTGREALAWLDDPDRAPPAAVVLDLGLPDIDGLQVLAATRRRHPDLPVVVLTLSTDVNTVVSAMRAGATEYLSKPVDREQLMSSLRKRADPLPAPPRDSVFTPFADIVGASPGMQTLFRQMQRVATRDVTVLIHGESGTGKELVARALHDASPRRNGPFVAINCAAIAQGLQESELFGHEKGAFTGAAQRHAGRFEQADGGTLFLDEIGEIAPSLQASLLRAIQERRFHRVGGAHEVRVDVRILGATHRDLIREVAGGRFREDLYYRLAVFELDVPPLRERGDDVLRIAERLLSNLCERHGAPAVRLSAEAARLLVGHDWPGNVRELQNALERGVVLAGGSVIKADDLPPRLRRRPVTQAAPAGAAVVANTAEQTAEIVEKTMLLDALARYQGNVSEVCRALGIARTTMYRKLKRHGIPT